MGGRERGGTSEARRFLHLSSSGGEPFGSGVLGKGRENGSRDSFSIGPWKLYNHPVQSRGEALRRG